MPKVPEADVTGLPSMGPSSSGKFGNAKRGEHADTINRKGGKQTFGEYPGTARNAKLGGGDEQIKQKEVKQSSDEKTKAGEVKGSGGDDEGGVLQACVSQVNNNEDESEKTMFPILLHEIVSDPETDDDYGHAKFTSFTRRLKHWIFSRVPSGPSMGAYCNADFRIAR